MFALVFVQAMTECMIENKETFDEETIDTIKAKFGSVQLGILSLTMSLTGGFDWGEMYDIVLLAGPIQMIACLFFVIFFTVSVWNIVGSPSLAM